MDYPFKKILCPIDFDENSITALDTAAEMARQSGAVLVVLHVVSMIIQPGETPVYVDVYAAEEQTSRDKLLALAKEHLAGVKHELKITVAQPSAAILHAQTATSADVIVMSTHGRRGLAHLVLGSVAEQIVREAPCPVLTVHGRPAQEATASAT